MSGLFDCPPSERSEERWEVELDLPDAWSVGLIVGPSGSGKSTIARELWPDQLSGAWDWPKDRSILDGFPAALGIKEITGLLSSVGFSSPPAWMRPFQVLSNGEQFRVNMARTLAELPALAVVDEFTSVVDRAVAKVGSYAVQKTVRRLEQQLIAVSCHYDIVEWLEPDWVYQPHTGELIRGRLQRRPDVQLEIYPLDRSAWSLFRQHHYLSAELHNGAQCFGAVLDGALVAFTSYLHFPHPKVRDIKTGHRLVVLPDYQGLGIGGRLDDWLGAHLHRQGYRYHNTVAHPAMVAYYNRSPRWTLLGHAKELQKGRNSSLAGGKTWHLNPRRLATYTFGYVPE